MYKLAKPDGWDFYTGNTINYRENIGKIIRVQDYDPPKKGDCGQGLHSSRNPLDCFVGASMPCSAYQVKNINVIVRGKNKTRSQAMKVIKEITDLDKLFGFNYSETINPINPLEIVPPEITQKHIQLLTQWSSVRGSARGSVRGLVGFSVRDSVRGSVRESVWDSVRVSVWGSVWDSVRCSVWDSVGDSVWASGRCSVWDSVWAYIGSLFPNIKKWYCLDSKHNDYPYQSCVDLWRIGLVPTFDGKKWRLHGGKDAEILWEGKNNERGVA